MRFYMVSLACPAKGEQITGKIPLHGSQIFHHDIFLSSPINVSKCNFDVISR